MNFHTIRHFFTSFLVTPAEAGAQGNQHSIEASWPSRLQDLECGPGSPLPRGRQEKGRGRQEKGRGRQVGGNLLTQKVTGTMMNFHTIRHFFTSFLVTPAEAGAQGNQHSIEASWPSRLQDLECGPGSPLPRGRQEKGRGRQEKGRGRQVGRILLTQKVTGSVICWNKHQGPLEENASMSLMVRL